MDNLFRGLEGPQADPLVLSDLVSGHAVYYRFDPSLALWVNSMGISLIIGAGLILSVAAPAGQKADRWQIFRLFLMPFCVSSFAALIKGHSYIFVFSTAPAELLVSVSACAIFVLCVFVLRKTVGKSPAA